jgi:hypothetical protein
MSAATKAKSITLPAPTVAAVQAACAALGLDDVRLASAAFIQTAIEGTQRNASFASRVQTLYRDLANAAKPGPTRQKKAAEPPLVPIREVPGWDPDPASAPDPYKLCQLYGAPQLRRAMARYKLPDLLLAMKQVQDRNPGTKPMSKKKDPVLDYIVQYVTGA